MRALSFEILELIATLLPAKDLYVCLSICRVWHANFQRALYRTIHIRSRRQFKSFCRCLQQRSGSLVRELILLNRVGITAQELDHLLLFCPFLEMFTLSADGSWKHLKPSAIFGWKYLRKLSPLHPKLASSLPSALACQLTNLTLRGDHARSLHRDAALLPLFGSLRKLQALTIGEVKDAWACSELPLDLPIIHQLLPELGYLELWNVGLHSFLPQNNFGQGAAKLHVLKVMSHLSDWHWLSYFAHTYPNIRTMVLNLRLKVLLERTMTRAEIVQAQESFLVMAGSYHRLERLSIDIPPKLWPGRQFMNTLNRKGRLLKEYHCLHEDWTPQMLHSISECGASTLSKIHVSLWKGTHDLLQAVQPLANCRSLESLDLSCGREDFMIHNSCAFDAILNHLPSVKHLTLHMCTLYISQDMGNAHGLRRLVLEDVRFTTAVLDYVSQWCQEIADLQLDYCMKLRDHLQQEIRIDMPACRFRSIRISYMCLSPEAKKRCDVDSTIFSLSQLDRSQRQRKNTDPDGQTRWYHMAEKHGNGWPDDDDEEMIRGRYLRGLNSQEIMRVKSFQMELSHWKNLESITRETYRTKSNWEMDLPYGYITIRCRSVDTLIFNYVELNTNHSDYFFPSSSPTSYPGTL
ncbi:hypothetical protein EC973_008116 [Apophysomyces ossiformis]|uniref:F-box domain-containing protein n=1 Tax=Apophysomyces ossiformis TaxID=679940 RepID=A0A8H7BSY9_9FUNG|nr:hypothetical protein EC973_008116 [Apophysomyces ossiformis]